MIFPAVEPDWPKIVRTSRQEAEVALLLIGVRVKVAAEVAEEAMMMTVEMVVKVAGIEIEIVVKVATRGLVVVRIAVKVIDVVVMLVMILRWLGWQWEWLRR